MKKVLFLFALLVSNVAAAACETSYPYNYSHSVECEKFSFEDISQVSHMFAGAFITVGGQQLLIKAGMKPLPALLTATATSMLIGATKETFVDAYTSRNGIRSFWFGAAVGASIALSWSF